MSDKKVVLKLLWNNLKLLKEKGISPDQTFDFLNEDEMVTYLFNEESRYVELLLLSLEMQPLEMIQQLNPNFVSLYQKFFVKDKIDEEVKVPVVKMETKKMETKKMETKKMETKKVESKKEVVIEEDDNVEDDESVVESEDQEELSDDEQEEQEEEEDGMEVNKFIEKHLLETDDTEDKVSLELIKEKYIEFCEDNEVEEDVEELESSLVIKFGKPKGKKKPSYKGVKLV